MSACLIQCQLLPAQVVLFPTAFWLIVVMACSRMTFLFERVLLNSLHALLALIDAVQLKLSDVVEHERDLALKLAEQRQEFLHHMSHEMRTPLNVSCGCGCGGGGEGEGALLGIARDGRACSAPRSC